MNNPIVKLDLDSITECWFGLWTKSTCSLFLSVEFNRICFPFPTVYDCVFKPGFHMSGKSQTIGDIYDFEFSLVGKIWDSRETAKSPIVWDFPDIWKPGFIWRIGSVSIFPARPRFLRWSAIIPDKWNLKFVPSGTSAMDFGVICLWFLSLPIL